MLVRFVNQQAANDYLGMKQPDDRQTEKVKIDE
jgi:hypothetical protein